MSAAEILFDPFLLEVVADPYPSYHRLRAAEPVHLSPLGVWLLSRYGDCVMPFAITGSVAGSPRLGRCR